MLTKYSPECTHESFYFTEEKTGMESNLPKVTQLVRDRKDLNRHLYSDTYPVIIGPEVTELETYCAGG